MLKKLILLFEETSTASLDSKLRFFGFLSSRAMFCFEIEYNIEIKIKTYILLRIFQYIVLYMYVQDYRSFFLIFREKLRS